MIKNNYKIKCILCTYDIIFICFLLLILLIFIFIWIDLIFVLLLLLLLHFLYALFWKKTTKIIIIELKQKQ